MKKILVMLLFLASTSVYAQRITVTGTVADEQSGTPLTGATVQVKGTMQGSITDVSGKYSIEVPGANSTLVFSFVGYGGKEVQVGNQTVINVTLEDAQARMILLLPYRKKATRQERSISNQFHSGESTMSNLTQIKRELFPTLQI
jgi:hypothetical protein